MSDYSKDTKRHHRANHKKNTVNGCQTNHCCCLCTSKFDICGIPNVTVTFLVPGPDPDVPMTGTLSLKGAICPNCDEDKGSFTLEFHDEDLTDGNSSFVFKTCTIVELACLVDLNSRNQIIMASGIYNPEMGFARRAVIQLELTKLEPGNDVIEFTIADSETAFTIVDGALQVPDHQLSIKECGK